MKRLRLGMNEVHNIAIDAHERYIYCCGRGIRIFDAHSFQYVQEIPDLGYALICTSPNGRYLGGVHASDNSESFDAIVWDVEAGHTEVCRVRITEACSTLFPVFSMDGEYMYFQAGFPISKLYSLSTRTGKLECVFCCKDGMSIRSLSAGAAGVIMVVQGEDTPASIEYIPVGVKNRCVQTILDFRFVASAQIDKIYASWLNDENIIIVYHMGRFRTGISVISLSQLHKKSEYSILVEKMFPFMTIANPQCSNDHTFVAFRTFTPTVKPYCARVFDVLNWSERLCYSSNRLQGCMFYGNDYMILNADELIMESIANDK